MSHAVILVVDDDSGARGALKRLLRQHDYQVLLANDGEQAIDTLRSRDDISLIICDYQMPGMNGAAVLNQAIKLRPKTERMALTGCDDTQTILEIVNSGEVMKLLIKPWNDEQLVKAVHEAAKAFQIVNEVERLEMLTQEQNDELRQLMDNLNQQVLERTAELEAARSQLEDSLTDTVTMLAKLLEMHMPGLRGHGMRVSQISMQLAQVLGLSAYEIRQVEISGLLHDLGKITVPAALLAKPLISLSTSERQIIQRHPVVGARLLKDIKGLLSATDIVLHHHERMDGRGYPNQLAGESIPLGARIVAVADMYDRRKYPAGQAVVVSRAKAETFLSLAAKNLLDASIVQVFLEQVLPGIEEASSGDSLEVAISSLKPRMVLAEDAKNVYGATLLAKFTRLTDALISKLQNCRQWDPAVCHVFIKTSSVPVDAEIETDPELTELSNTTTIDIAEQVKASERVIQETDEPGERLRVLIVDDDQRIISALKRELKSAGYAPEGFLSPILGLRRIQEDIEIFALISDYMMPGMSGDRFIGEVRQIRPDLPCIVITGQATVDAVQKLNEAGKICRILAKPWDRAALMIALDELK